MEIQKNLRAKTAPLKPSLQPMEARSAEEMPAGDGWQYEPK
jgi:ATP-dependent DNA ligase